MDLPRHPGQDDATPGETAPSKRTKLIIAVVVALILLVVILHLTGTIKH